MKLRILVALAATAFATTGSAQTIRAELKYQAPVDGQPRPHFSPKGTQVALTRMNDNSALASNMISLGLRWRR